MGLALSEGSQKYAGDTPNKDHDWLSEHVIAIRTGRQRSISSAIVSGPDSNTSVLEVVSETIIKRLKVVPGETIDHISPQLLRKHLVMLSNLSIQAYPQSFSNS